MVYDPLVYPTDNEVFSSLPSGSGIPEPVRYTTSGRVTVRQALFEYSDPQSDVIWHL